MSNTENKEQEKKEVTAEIELANAIKALQVKQAEFDEKLKAIEKKNVEAIRAIIVGRDVVISDEETETPMEKDPEEELIETLSKKFKV